MEYYVVLTVEISTSHFENNFVVKKKQKNAIVVEFNEISDWICKLRRRGRNRKMTIINVHALAN